MKKAKQQVLFPLESGQRAQLPTSSPTYYKVTIIYSRAHSPALQTAILLTPLLLHYLPRLLCIYIYLHNEYLSSQLGVRLSGYFLNAVMWYASVTNSTQYHGNTTVLDSQINGTINYTPPILRVR